MRLRLRWIFRLLHRVLAGIHLTCILFFISDRTLRLHFRVKQEGKELGFQHLHPEGLGWLGGVTAFLYPATDRRSSLVGKMPR